MIAAIVLAVYGAYIVFDFIPVLRTKKPVYIWPCIILFFIGAVVQLLHELNFSVPSPAPVISEFISGLFILE